LLYCKAQKEKPQVDFKLHIKPLVILFNIGVSMHFGKRKTRLEESWEVLKKLSLAPSMCFWSANASNGWKAAYAWWQKI